jgi:hypothetical protein
VIAIVGYIRVLQIEWREIHLAVWKADHAKVAVQILGE